MAASRRAADEVIEYVPHWGVITQEGETHFHNAAEAIMEHIDNSITVCAASPDEQGRKIEVLVLMPATGAEDKRENGLLAIFDAGQGMGLKELQAYFTCNLDRKRRGLQPQEEDTTMHPHLRSSLSKFGVGALQSFAFLGTELKVVSKSREDGQLRSYAISPESFEQKEALGGRTDAYKGKVEKLKSAVEALNEKERRYPLLEKHMHEHRKLNSFTYILIHLRPAIKAELAQDGATLMTRLLSDVYYYQLKPSALPEFSSMGRSSRAEGTKSPGGPLKKLKGSSSGAQASSGKSSSSPLEASKVDIAVTFNRNNAARSYTSVLLEQLDKCMEGHYLNKAVGEPFIAQLEVDDPTYVPMEDESEVTLRPRFKCYMVARYYPYRGHAETKPNSARVNRVVIEESRGQLQDDDDDGKEDEPVDPIISVRWQGRKLPEAGYQRLHFFPAQSKAKTVSDVYGEWWKRLHVTLFFADWSFPVSNNKLTVRGSFDAVLNDKNRVRGERDLVPRFLEWLKHHHVAYDKEFTYHDPIVHRPPEARATSNCKYYEKVKFGSGEAAVWQKNEAMSVEQKVAATKKRAAPGASAVKSKETHYGHILFFEVPQNGGKPLAYYRREPLDVYAGEVFTIPVKDLDWKGGKYRESEWNEAMANVNRRKVKDMVVSVWDGVRRDSMDKVAAGMLDGTEGEPLPCRHLLVGLRDSVKRPKEVIHFITHKNSLVENMYIVAAAIKDQHSEHVHHEWTANAVVDEVTCPQYPISIPEDFTLPKGSYLLVVRVIQANNPSATGLPMKALSFEVGAAIAGPPVAIEVAGLDKLEFAIAEEMPVPAFSVLLKDERGRYATCQSITIEMEVDGFALEYRGKTNLGKKRQRQAAPTFELTAEKAEDGVSFAAGDFVAMLVDESEPMLGNKGPRVITKPCRLIVTCSGSVHVHEVMCNVTPGRPVKLQLTAGDKAISKPIENMSTLPDLALRVLDYGGNTTAPAASETWSVSCSWPEGVKAVEARPCKEVNGMGEVLLSGIKVEADLASEREARAGSGSPRSKGKEVVLKVHVVAPQQRASGSSSASLSRLALDIPLLITPRKGFPVVAVLDLRGKDEAGKAVALEVVGSDKPPTQAKPYDVMVGTVFDQVQLRVLDEVGDTVDWARVQAEAEVSWEKKRTFRNGQLTAITAPTTIPKTPLSHRASVSFNSAKYQGLSFHFLFDFVLKAGKPANTWFSGDWSTAVQSGVPFSRLKAEIRYRDKHKNNIKATPDLPVPSIQWVDNQAVRFLPSSSLPAQLDPDSGNYYVREEMTVIGKAGEALRVRLVTPGMQNVRYDLKLEAGPPKELLLGGAAEPGQAPSLDKTMTLRLAQGEYARGVRVDVRDTDGINQAKIQGDGCTLVVVPAERTTRASGASARADVLCTHPVAAGTVGPYTLPGFAYPYSGDRVLNVELRSKNQVLCRAEVTCKHYKVNRVVDIRPFFLAPDAAAQLLSVGEDHETLQLKAKARELETAFNQWTADMKPPALLVRFETEDNEAPKLTPGCLDLKVLKSSGGHPLQWYGKFTSCTDQEGKRLAVWVPSIDATMDPASYRLHVAYHEQREDIKSLTDAAKLRLETAKDMLVGPGLAVALKPREPLRSGITASNRADHKESRKLLDASVFVPVDRCDTPTSHTEPAYVWCCREQPSSEAAAEQEGQAEGGADLPRLAGADAQGRVSATTSSSSGGRTEYRFRALYLVENEGSTPGTYSLCFGGAGLRSHHVSFTFVTDAGRHRAIADVQAKLGPLEAEDGLYRQELLQLDAKVKALQHQARPLFTKVTNVAGYDPQQLRQAAFRDNERNSMQAYVQTLEQKQGRRYRKPQSYPPPGISEVVKYYGFVYEMGCVDDPRTAELLSWYANQRSMKAIVVERNQDYYVLRDRFRGVPVYSVEDTLSCSATLGIQPKRSGVGLALYEVQAPGFVDYAVNAIQLRPEHERFRSTVFWDIYGTTMIFDTERNAMAYRAQCRTRRVTMLTLQEGRRILSKGPLDAEDCLPTEGHGRPSFVFGAVPATETAEYTRSKELLEDLQGLDRLLLEEEELRMKLEKLTRDPKAAERTRKMHELKRQIQQLMQPGARA